jgi:putative ABC transport system permease protein
MVDLALKSLLHDKLRFVITVSGVAFAVTLILVQVGLFTGLLDNSTVTIRQADADLWVTSKNTPNVDFAHAFSESRVDRVRSIEGVERADNLVIAFLPIALPTGAEETLLVYALDDFRRWNLPWNVESGNVDDLRRGDYMMLDASAERRFGAFHAGEYREVAGRRIKVIGRTREAKSFTTTPIAFMDLGRVQEVARMRASATYVLVKLSPGADAAAVKAEIQKRLPHNDVFTRDEWAARSRGYWITSTGIGFNMFMTVFLGCLVGVVVVAQTLYTQTMEHIREFGTVKAIGGSNADIYRILFRQAGIAAIVGFALGLAPALAARPLVEKAGLALVITPTFMGIVLAGTLGLCLLASMVSFRKVASIDPGLVFRG